MTGVEIDMVLPDSLVALALYEQVFAVQRVEATNYERGRNEAVFTMYGTRFHLLDENPSAQLFAPIPGAAQSVWCNVVVPDIQVTCQKALEAGCVALQPVTEIADMGVSIAMFADPFGYLWMLHQIHRVVSFEERCRYMEQMQ